MNTVASRNLTSILLLLLVFGLCLVTVAQADWEDEDSVISNGSSGESRHKDSEGTFTSGCDPKYGECGFSLTELFSDEDYTLEDLTDNTPLVLLTWGPDCPHCRMQMPYAVALYKKLDLDQVNYYTFSATGKADAIEKYVEDHELTFPVLIKGITGGYGSIYEEEGWPTTFVFAPGGSLLGKCDTPGPSYITETMELVEDALSQVVDEEEPIDPQDAVSQLVNDLLTTTDKTSEPDEPIVDEPVEDDETKVDESEEDEVEDDEEEDEVEEPEDPEPVDPWWERKKQRPR